eukprot:290188-Hanusia_phi.AAC.1
MLGKWRGKRENRVKLKLRGERDCMAMFGQQWQGERDGRERLYGDVWATMSGRARWEREGSEDKGRKRGGRGGGGSQERETT